MTADSRGDKQAVRAAALHCAFEELLDQVVASEREWRLMDRIDMAIRFQEWRDDRDAHERRGA